VKNPMLGAAQVGQQAPAVVGGRQGPGAALQHIAFSSDGLLLVTVDVRQDAGVGTVGCAPTPAGSHCTHWTSPLLQCLLV
jgi:hypothetical protein